MVRQTHLILFGQAGSGHVAVSQGHLPVLDEQSGEREDVQQPLHLGACEQRREQQPLHAFLDQIPDHLARDRCVTAGWLAR